MTTPRNGYQQENSFVKAQAGLRGTPQVDSTGATNHASPKLQGNRPLRGILLWHGKDRARDEARPEFYGYRTLWGAGDSGNHRRLPHLSYSGTFCGECAETEDKRWSEVSGLEQK